MRNQNTPREASSTTITGTTIAGIRVEVFVEEDFSEATLLVAAAEVLEVVVEWVLVEAERAAADVRDAYSDWLVMILVLVVTTVERVSRLVMDSTRDSVSVTVVKPDGASAVTICGVAEGSAVTPLAPID
jgi:hypothetical protein